LKTYIFDEVENTQALAVDYFTKDPVLIIAKNQSKGRGRKGSNWENADQALACSLAFSGKEEGVKESLLPLVASYEFSSLYQEKDISLKWPNDLMVDGKKIGGVMIEKFGGTYITGLGINYYWKSPSVLSAGSLFQQEISFEEINKSAENWAINFLDACMQSDFDLEMYKLKCSTLGKLVEYPDGRGWAKDINEDGSLKIEKEDGKVISIYESMISEVSL
jgi:biotin-[acetyl-CoA-carboxylase] ligase BirA-like protein